MKNKIFLIYLWIAFFEIITILFIIPESAINKNADLEMRKYENTLTEYESSTVIEYANDWYKMLIEDSNLDEWIHRSLIPSKKMKSDSGALNNLGDGVFSWLEKRYQTTKVTIYLMLCRISLIYCWTSILLIFFICCIISGLLARKIRQISFEISSSVRFYYSLKIILLSFLLITLLLPLPISLPSYIFIFIIEIIGIAISISIANTQKRM